MVASSRPRVWLVGRAQLPADVQQVRDDQGRVWQRGADDWFHTVDNRHHLADRDLSARTDLVEVAR